jgi:hypothetical protein
LAGSRDSAKPLVAMNADVAVAIQSKEIDLRFVRMGSPVCLFRAAASPSSMFAS